MKRTIFWGVCIGAWAMSMAYIWDADGTRILTPDEASKITGADTGWCNDNGTCQIFATQCNVTLCAGGQTGGPCGKEREPLYAETCDPNLGNAYCDLSNPDEVQVICAKEWNCFCEIQAPPAGGGDPTVSCKKDEGEAGPGDPWVYVPAVIHTDSLTCSYTAEGSV